MARILTSTFPFAALLAAGLTAQDKMEDDAWKRVLRADGKVAARLVQREWNPEDPRPTCKLYHHVYAPDGRLLTKGEGGQFEHHRGLFVGWNQTIWGKQRKDFWHMRDGARQELEQNMSPAQMNLGPRGQHLKVWWKTDDAMPIVEHRGLEIIEESKQHHVLRMRVVLTTFEEGGVTLQGDPQHSGQQFRALQQFAEKDAEPVRYVRPEGVEEKGNDVWTGCGWTAAVLPLADGPVIVLRVEHPQNPGAAIWSTRPYGRFGATRKLKVTKDEPARLEFQYLIALGEQDRSWCDEHATRLAEAMVAEWKKVGLGAGNDKR